MSKIKIFAIFAITIILTVGLAMNNNETKIRAGFPDHWGPLVPVLQHTGYGDVVMSNQFEALVQEVTGGLIEALAAKSWKVNDNYTVFTFKIDTTRRFSNGKHLEASDFKRSWEEGLRLAPKSTNPSPEEILYNVVGFEKFGEKGELEGLKVLDKETFQVTFKRPFRVALLQMAGTRMAAFVKDGGKYLGTGPYIIEEKKNTLTYRKNPFTVDDVGYSVIHQKIIKPENAEKALLNGEIDIFPLAEFADMSDCLKGDSKISCYSGSEARHQAIRVNGLKGHFFSNAQHRRALQALIHKALTPNELADYLKPSTRIDPQLFLPLQKGRLDKDEATKIIQEGEQYIDDFIEATKKNPLYLVTSESDDWIQRFLKREGVKLTKNSGQVTLKEKVGMYFDTFEPDLIVSAFSVASGDPDGVYHCLGKHGSISSPIQERPDTMRLLEEGKQIIPLEDAVETYEKLSRAVLREVPFIHIGFTRAIVAYRNDKIKIISKYKHREDNRLSIYEPK